MENLWLLLVGAISYFLGSIPFAQIVSKKMIKKNIWEIGSGNVGATNVFRNTNSIGAFTIVWLGDMIKGIVSIQMVGWLGFLGYSSEMGLSTAIFFVIIGHDYSCFLKFKGGKGLASLMGVLLALNWHLFLMSAGIILFMIFIVKAFYDLFTRNLASWKNLSRIRKIIDYRIGILSTFLNLILVSFYQPSLALPLLIVVVVICFKCVGITDFSNHSNHTKTKLNKMAR